MTLQYLIEPEDLSSIRLTCRACTASLNVPFTEYHYVPESCPYCKAEWFKRSAVEEVHQVTWVIQGLTAIQKWTKEGACAFSFEMCTPKPK
jgi:hypothetical protein